MTRLHRIIPLAFAILAIATPAQARVDDPNVFSNPPGNVQDLLSPDPSDPATGYTRARVQDLRSPGTRDIAAARSAPSATHRDEAIDGTTWALLAFALVASGGLIFGLSRARRTRIPA